MEKQIVGMRDGTYFEIVSEVWSGEKPYWPSIRDGQHLSILDVGTDEYLKHKKKVMRQTTRYAVSGNAVCAEDALQELGYNCMATSPTTIEIYGKDQ